MNTRAGDRRSEFLPAGCDAVMSQMAAYIDGASQIYLVTHIDPDGDAIGSLLGFGWALRALGKGITLVCQDLVPAAFTFLPGSDEVTAQPPAGEDLLISLDAGDPTRLGDVYDGDRFAGKPLVNIDHHVTNTRFGTLVLIDSSAAATAEILLGVIEGLGIPLDRRTATCLLTGIVTDTRGFRTSNTTPRVLRAATVLMEAGASLPDITQRVFESKPLTSLCVLGQVLAVMQVENGVIWSHITQDTLRRCGADPGDVRDIVSLLNSTQEARLAILFHEEPDGSIDVGFRSKPGVDVSRIAARLGGGGHRQASGCHLPGPLTEARELVLATIRAMLNGEKTRNL